MVERRRASLRPYGIVEATWPTSSRLLFRVTPRTTSAVRSPLWGCTWTEERLGWDLGQLGQGFIDRRFIEFVVWELLPMVSIIGPQVEMAVTAGVEKNDFRLA